MHQLHAVLRRLPDLRPGPEFIGPAAIALAQRYNLDSRDQGAAERLEMLSQHEGIWGCTFVGECTKVCPKNVDPAGAIQRYKLEARRSQSLKAFFMPWGGAMTTTAGYTAYHPRWLPPRKSTYWWLERRSYLAFILRELSSVFVAWFVVFLLLLVRAVGQGDASTEISWPGRRRRRCCC